MTLRRSWPSPRRRNWASLALALTALLGATLDALAGPIGSCTGDCNGDVTVTVNELIVGVNIALGTVSVAACPVFDRDRNDRVEIGELLQAVNNSVVACSFVVTPPATHTPDAAPTPTSAIIDLGRVAVVNELDRNVSFLRTDGTGAGSAGAVPIDGIPRDVAIAADGSLAYVTTRSPDGITVIDIGAAAVAMTIPARGALPEAVACAPGKILVTNFGSNSVSVIDEVAVQRLLRQRADARMVEAGVAGGGVMQEVVVGSLPNNLAVDAAGARAYVTNFGSRTVSVIDVTLPTPCVEKTIEVGDNPNGVAIRPDGRFTYVSRFSSPRVSVIDNAPGGAVVDLPLSTFEGDQTLPTNLALSPDGRLLYITSFNFRRDEQGLDQRASGLVFVYDVTGDLPLLVARIDFTTSAALTDSLPTAVEVSPAGDCALVSNFLIEQDPAAGMLRARADGGSLLMIETTSNAMLDVAPVGNFPVSLAGVPPATPAGSVTETPLGAPPTATPSTDELCGQFVCSAPSICVRDLGCHKNGCVPHDKCCSAEELNCLACRGGTRDGAPCVEGAECPGGSCEP